MDAILEDLTSLGVVPDRVVHSSDHFDKILELCEKLITDGNAYLDNTPVEQMRQERWDGIASALRDTPIEENLRLWEELKKGSEQGQGYIVRAKISFNNKNKCLRDPAIYRLVDKSHPRTGDKYKVYPTYDFACPIVDTLDGVSHTMRSVEFNDRKDQYLWFLKKLGYPKLKIYEYSKLAFTNTIMSKRYLRKIVDDGVVDGWSDPRFPTVRGILRRGMLVETLVEFMMEQGPSKNNNLQQWDKIWSLNKKKMESLAGKFCAVPESRISTLTITNGDPKVVCTMQPVHKKNKALGTFPLYTSNQFFISYDDAVLLKDDEKITLMNFMNVKLTKLVAPTNDQEGFTIEAEALPEDKDFKTTPKISWVIADRSLLVREPH